MSETYKNLIRRAAYNSNAAIQELQSRQAQYIDTGLRGIFNESILFRYSDEILEYKTYISQNINKKMKNSTIATILLDSFASATIEGARTTIASVQNSIKQPTTKDDKMVVNTLKAQQIAYEMSITVENIRPLWEILVKDVCENVHADGPKYRSGQVYIGNATQIVHTPERPENIEIKMQDLFNLMTKFNDKLVLACITHFYFVYIHPFCDGNGRFARLWQNVILSNYNINFRGLVISNEINKALSEYYKVIQDAEFTYNNMIDITPFIEYMLKCICSALDYMAIRRYVKLGPTESQVLLRMQKSQAGLTVKKLMELQGLTESTAYNLLNKLVSKGYVVVDKTSRPYRYYAK